MSTTPAASTVQLGKDCTLVVGGSTISNVVDVTLSMSASEIDVTTRASGGWKEYKIGNRECTIEGNIVYKTGDEGVAVLMEAFESGDSVSVTCAPISGSFVVSAINYEQPLEDKVNIAFTLKSSSGLTLS